MFSKSRLRQHLGISALLVGVLWVSRASGISMTYCSSVNTASMNANHSIYQSNGLCQQFCFGDYAFAILQGDSCWCSDVAPDSSTNVNTNRCNSKCPGFPDDTCGGDGLFGYISLSKDPVSTSGARPKTTPGHPYTHPPAPTVSVATVTADGSVTVKTVLVTPTVGINSQGQAGMTSSSNGLSPGAAAGIAVGAIALVIMIAAAIFCCWMQRRRKRETEDGLIGGSVLGRSPGGATSASSPTNMSQTNQFVTNAVVGQELRRQSHLMPVDPRLDYSFGMYADANKSHDSINTIHDERDYSRRLNQPRVLRPTNPDPED